MIISRAPVRITLGGGGTDLKSYYARCGGFLIAAAIDRYVFISANKRFYDSIRLSYSETEIVDDVSKIKHRIYREALKQLKIDGGIELVSIADVPSNCGLGTSSAFTVSLLNALHTYKREYVTQRQLAEEACRLEIEILGEPIGKQDQYMTAFGGITCLTFEKNGDVTVEPLRISDDTIDQMESNLLLFYSGIERSASAILRDQNTKSQQDDAEMLSNLDQIKQIAVDTKKALEKGELNEFGRLLDVHWQTKKRRSRNITDPFLDECYETAMKNGAVGGKIMGAGGGGFFMFYCDNSDRPKLSQAMKKTGLMPMKFHFDFEGAKILVNMKRF
jgi:D-glycero-alpha-D-manno-heptose-7-phosphate kinase